MDLTPPSLADALGAVSQTLRDQAAQIEALKARERYLIAEGEDRDRFIDLLKGALAGAGLDAIPERPAALEGLTTQELALVGALAANYPRAIGAYDLTECLPGLDDARVGGPNLISTMVFNIRGKVGREAIISARGRGYRLSPAFHASLKPPSTGEDHGRSGE